MLFNTPGFFIYFPMAFCRNGENSSTGTKRRERTAPAARTLGAGPEGGRAMKLPEARARAPSGNPTWQAGKSHVNICKWRFLAGKIIHLYAGCEKACHVWVRDISHGREHGTSIKLRKMRQKQTSSTTMSLSIYVCWPRVCDICLDSYSHNYTMDLNRHQSARRVPANS